MKKILILIMVCYCSAPISKAQLIQDNDYQNNYKQIMERTEWWRDASFGMFIHFGAYSYLELGEWEMYSNKWTITKYEDNVARKFNPVNFNAQAIVALAKNAGQKYIVFTTKHHEGFSMWDTKVSGYNPYDIVHFGSFGRDLVREISIECKKQGIHFCTYYSIMDWHNASMTNWGEVCLDHAALLNGVKAQLKELIVDYGSENVWFDGNWMKWLTDKDYKDIEDYCRSLNPDILIGAISPLGKGGDYTPYEVHQIGKWPGSLLYEVCMSMQDSWGYSSNKGCIPAKELIADHLVQYRSKGWNFLLNIGPDSSGNVPRDQEESLNKIGQWLKVNGESIYGTEASPFTTVPSWGAYTKKGDKLYCHVKKYPDMPYQITANTENGKTVENVYRLDNGAALPYAVNGHNVKVTLPTSKPDSIVLVVVIKCSGN